MKRRVSKTGENQAISVCRETKKSEIEHNLVVTKKRMQSWERRAVPCVGVSVSYKERGAAETKASVCIQPLPFY